MSKNCVTPNNTETVDEMLRSLASREGDITGSRFLQYRGVAMEVWRDMKLYAVKYTKRYLVDVDPRTNSITLEDDFLFRSSLSYIDSCNKIVPFSINQNLQDDIIDIGQDHNCYCECGCKSDLCGHIKSYEAIITNTTEELPGGGSQVFQSISRKRMDEGGRFVLENTFPIRIYNDEGVWTGVELTTEVQELCTLEVDTCGCVKQTKDNCKNVDSCCNAATFMTECGDPRCIIPANEGYNFSEEGNRIVFPSTFNRKKVLVRYFAEESIKDIRVPLIAKETFLYGIKAFIAPFDDSIRVGRAQEWVFNYEGKKEKLSILMNRFSMKEVKQVLTPKRYMP
jgi:hypothetical protein